MTRNTCVRMAWVITAAAGISLSPAVTAAQMGPMPLVAPLFIEDQRRSSVVTMVNNAPAGLDLDVVLYSLSGNQLAKRTVSLLPHSQQTITVASLLQSSGNQYGSVFLVPHRATTMAAQLSIAAATGSGLGDIEEEFAMLMSPTAANYRGVSLSSRPVIAITSLSNAKQNVSVSCLSSIGNVNGDLSIGPNQTLLVDACGKSGPATVPGLPDSSVDGKGDTAGAAVWVSSPVPSMELAVFGIGGSDAGGHRSAMPFADANSLKSSTAIYPGVSGAGIPWAGFRPAVANFGAVAHQASILLSQTDGTAGTQKTLATLTLPPHSVTVGTEIDPPVAPETGASLVIASDAPPGEVISMVQAGPASASAPVILPWKDQAQIPNGGQHPWRTDAGTVSSIVLYNPDSSRDATLPVTIYANGSAWTKKVTVGSLATVTMRINDIINGQQADDQGHKLPPGSVEGVASWLTLAKPKLFGMLVQNSPAASAIRPFACAETYALCSLTLPSENVAVGDQTGYLSPTTYTCGSNGDCNCVENCGIGGSSLTSYYWSSTNSSIASLVSNPSYSVGNYQGMAAGSTYTDLNAYDNLGCYAGGTGPISVTPSVTIQVQQGFVSMAGNGLVVLGGPGGLTTTAITAVGNPSGGSVTWSAGPRLQINGVNAANASVTGTSASASGGDTYISVQYTVSGQSANASVRFTVLNPTIFNASNYPGGAGATQPYNSGNNSGYITNITYYVMDQMNPSNIIALPGITDSELLTTTSNPYGATFYPPDGQPLGATSNGAGQFFDYLYAYAPGGLPQGFSASRSQSWTVNGFAFTPSQGQNYTASSGTITQQNLTRQ